jgi:hypothetical protein
MRRVRPGQVVVQPPAFDDSTGLGQVGEHLLIQALVAELAVEALDEAGPRDLSYTTAWVATTRC